MVGVARIELATPAMSTQNVREKERISGLFLSAEGGTPREQTANIFQFHRTYTGGISPPRYQRAPASAGTDARAEFGFQTEGKPKGCYSILREGCNG
jgi:hypothetical protein